MVSVVIGGENKNDIEAVLKLAKKLGLNTKKLSKTQIEDFHLGEQIEKGMKTPKVSRAEVMKALGK